VFLVSASLTINIASVSAIGIDLSLIPSVGLCLCVCLCVRKAYCGIMAEWIRMPIGEVSGVGRGMGVLDGVVIVEGEGTV